jgi:hypothetical protein
MANITGLGRIKRIGTDTVTNYSLLATASYDSAHPAATTSALSDASLLDQSVLNPVSAPTETTKEGILLTFARFPAYFTGIVTKVRPTYTDTTTAIELWTHNSQDNIWTLRRKIAFANPFAGTPTDTVKVFDLRLAAPIPQVDKVWVTMAPGATPTMRFEALHCFGRCHLNIEIPGSCNDDPAIDCINPTPCEEDVDSCLVAPAVPGAIPDDGPPPTVLDCHDFGPHACDIPPFDWPRAGRPDPFGGPGPSDPPAFPIVDLCDPVALAAFEASLTPEQLDYFQALLDAAELPCLAPSSDPSQPNEIPDKAPIEPVSSRQPTEVYVDPVTLQAAQDPKAGGVGPLTTPNPLPTPSVVSDPNEVHVITKVQRIFVASTVTGTDADIWSALVVETQDTPDSHAIIHLAGVEHWPIVRLSGSLSGVQYKLRYDGFVSDAIVDIQSARTSGSVPGGGGSVGDVRMFTSPPNFYYFDNRFLPAGGSLTANPGVEVIWTAQTTSGDFTLTGSADNYGDVAICVFASVTQGTAVANLRIETV